MISLFREAIRQSFPILTCVYLRSLVLFKFYWWNHDLNCFREGVAAEWWQPHWAADPWMVNSNPRPSGWNILLLNSWSFPMVFCLLIEVSTKRQISSANYSTERMFAILTSTSFLLIHAKFDGLRVILTASSELHQSASYNYCGITIIIPPVE